MNPERIGLVLLLLALALGSGAAPVSAQHMEFGRMDQDWTGDERNRPALPDDENCDAGHDDEGGDVQECRLVRATPDLSSGTLALEGNFCLDPMVSMGTTGGTLDPVEIFDSDAGFILADLSQHMVAGTAVVVVECPCADCAMDITLGTVGPTGPQGQQGITGPTGPQGIPGPPGEDGASFDARNIYVRECVDMVECPCDDPRDRAIGGGAFCVLPSSPQPDATLLDSLPAGSSWLARCKAPSTSPVAPAQIRVVCLCLRDDCGESPNRPPVAVIDVVPPSPANIANGPVTVNFISRSHDPDGDPITCYEWTILSTIGPLVRILGSDASLVSQIFVNEQQLDVRLRVSDETEAPCDEDTQFSPHVDTLQGYLICANTPPYAVITIVSMEETPFMVRYEVSGSASADPEFGIQSYHWDCGNGQQPTGALAECIYARAVEAQVFDIELIVQDYSVEPGCVLQSQPARVTVVVPGLAN
jgi:hypothetical protein